MTHFAGTRPLQATGRKYYWVGSLEKGLNLLELLSKEGKASLSEAAAQLGLDRSSCHRAMLTMRDLGFVRAVPGGGYQLTGKLYEMALRQDRDLELRSVIRPVMQRLRNQYGETVNLGSWQGDSVLYLEKCESPEILRADLAVGTRIPLYCTGLGKALLAFRPREELEEILNGLTITAHTDTTIPDKDALRKVLARIRETGISYDRQELHNGLNCVAVPLMRNGRPPRMALSIAGPAARFGQEKMENVGRVLKQTALEIDSLMEGR